ncbi:MAG: methionyl-tRNA formyltransferase [Pirellulaceae bacterium]|nr:MAG: methionyl-tRNA formyltransferase [Pirellulaceae bacterium]
MRLVVVANGAFAVPTLEALCESRHQVVGVVTRPAPPSVGRRPVCRPVWQAATARGLVVFEPATINDPASVEWLRNRQADLLVVCDYGEILRKTVLEESAPLGAVNLHGSLLPKYRGAAPVAWAIFNGEVQTGVSVIRITPRLDAGPILVQRATNIGPDETTPELEARLAKLGAEAVLEALSLLENWDGHSPLGTPQDPRQVTLAPRLTRSMGCIDWSWPAETIRNHVRAMVPWPGSFTWWVSGQRASKPMRLILHRVQAVAGSSGEKPGTVVHAGQGGLRVQAGEGTAVDIQQLQPEGRRPMPAEAFLRGYPIRAGDLLTNEPAEQSPRES